MQTVIACRFPEALLLMVQSNPGAEGTGLSGGGPAGGHCAERAATYLEGRLHACHPGQRNEGQLPACYRLRTCHRVPRACTIACMWEASTTLAHVIVADRALLLMQTAVHACPRLFGAHAGALRGVCLCAGEDCGERS